MAGVKFLKRKKLHLGLKNNRSTARSPKDIYKTQPNAIGRSCDLSPCINFIL